MSERQFSRVLLKLSGEALMGERSYGQDPERIAAVARAVREVAETGLEIGAQAILMGKNGVDGVLDDDPRTNPNAQLIPALTHIEAIERGLKVMDTTALSLCMDNGLPLYVFNLDDEHNIARIVRGERLGTIISSVPGGLPVQVTS